MSGLLIFLGIALFCFMEGYVEVGLMFLAFAGAGWWGRRFGGAGD